MPFFTDCKSKIQWLRDDVIKWKRFSRYCPFVRPVTGGFPSQRPVTRSFDIFFYLRRNKRLSKQPRRRRFDTPSRSLWRQCNVVLVPEFTVFTETSNSQYLTLPSTSLEKGYRHIQTSLYHMMTSSNGNIFCVTGHLCGEFTGPRWILRTKASDVDALMFSLICVWINVWVNNRDAGDLRRYRGHYDVIVMKMQNYMVIFNSWRRIIEI